MNKFLIFGLVKNIVKSHKMTSQFESKASQAEILIRELRQEINTIRENVLSKFYNSEQSRLKIENDTIRREIEEWKRTLIQLEIAHGVTQVPIPSAKRIKEDTPTEETHPVAQPSPSPPKTIKLEKPTQKPAEKAPKPEKPPKEAKSTANKVIEDDKFDVGRLDLRIGCIKAIDKHPDADALYVEQIDLAEDKPRTIVSGLVKHIKAEDLKDRLVMVLCNLKPAKMRGVTSEGMVMCASSPDKVEVLIPPPGAVPGDKVTCQGYDLRPDLPFMNPKKKIFEQVAPDLKANSEGIATYQGIPLEIPGKGIIKAPTMTNCQIK